MATTRSEKIGAKPTALKLTTGAKSAAGAGKKLSAKIEMAQSPPVTEKPAVVPAVAQSSLYVVTVSNLTGLLSKIEKLDESGARTELNEDQYTQALGYASPAIYHDQVMSQVNYYYQGLDEYMTQLGVGG